MNRFLLNNLLKKMKSNLLEVKGIGNLKIGALLALGSQLEAVFYYLGHELGLLFDVPKISDLTKIPAELAKIIKKYNLGEIDITGLSQEQISHEHLSVKLRNCLTCKDLLSSKISAEGTFCSFEAGLLAALVEKMSDLQCFAQEEKCSLQTDQSYCEFIIVYQKD